MEAAEPETALADLTDTVMTRKHNNCVITLFVFMALLLVIFAYQMHPALAAQEDKEIIAGVPTNFPPQYQVDAKTGKPYGFAIDVMDEIAHRNGIKVRYVVYGNFSDVMLAMQMGEIDIIPNLGITEERKNYTDFTAPVETFHIHIFVRSTTDGIKNIDDLTGRKVAVVAENQGYFIMKERGGVELLVYNSLEEALMALISGNADAMVYPEDPLLRVARRSGIEDRIKTAGEALVEIKRAIGVRKGQPELYNKLNETVKAFILTLEYGKLYTKWYGKPEPYWNTERVLAALGITIAIATVIFFVIHYFSLLRLNKKLRESEEKYRNLVERSNDGILIIQDGLVKFANVRLAELWGGSAEELLETPIIQHIHPDERDKVMEHYQRRMANEDVPPIYETVLLRKDSTVLHIEINAGVISYKGKPADLVMIRDITERKKIEKEILQQREFLKNIFESLTHPFYVIDASDHTIIMANPAARFGELTASSKCYFTHGRDKPCSGEYVCTLEEVKKKKKPVVVEHVHYDKDGNAKNVEVYGYPIFDKEGNIVQMIEYCMDITERKKAEKALRESERSLSKAQQIAHIGNWSWDVQTNELQWSDENYRIFGISREKVSPSLEAFFNYVHPYDIEFVKRAIDGALNGKREYNIDFRIIRPDGLERFVNAQAEVSFDNAGKPIKMEGTLQDITERKKAEEEITFLASIVKNVPDAICSIDLNEKIVSWNKGAEKTLGYKAEEIIGKPITITIPEERVRKELDHCIGVLNAQGFFTDYESVRLTKDGRVIPVEITAVALKDLEQNVTRYTSIIKDITERKKAEELRLDNVCLEAADKAKSEFLANMSHELRTPLNAIIGFSEIMKQGITGEMNKKQEHFIDNILSSGTFLLSLINDILDLSKIEAGKIELVIEKFSVNQAIDETLILIKERASKHNVIIKKEFTPQLDIEGDKQRFKQVLFNLLSNAVKFSKEDGGGVTIKTEKEGDMAKISVSDTGIGIKEENMGKLFQKFQQLEPEISGKYGGTGLGLAISKHLAELHGGKILAESRYGEGSTFTILLPLKAKSKEENK